MHTVYIREGAAYEHITRFHFRVAFVFGMYTSFGAVYTNLYSTILKNTVYEYDDHCHLQIPKIFIKNICNVVWTTLQYLNFCIDFR